MQAMMFRSKNRPTAVIVEDGSGTRELSRLILESEGFHCLCADMAETAMELLNQHRKITILFSDIYFPGKLNGIDLAKFASHPPRNIPVLLTSGFSLENIEDILPDNVGFLEKPYTPTALLQAVYSLISRQRPCCSLSSLSDC